MIPTSGIEHVSVHEASNSFSPNLDSKLFVTEYEKNSSEIVKPDDFSKFGWSREVTDYILNETECHVYEDAGLVEGKVGNKTALMNPDIDWEQNNPVMRYTLEEFNTLFFKQLPLGFDSIQGLMESNQERASQGYAPLDHEGHAIELHHVGQKIDSPLAELTTTEHDSPGLHDNSIRSEVHTSKNDWRSQKQEYWINRANQL